MTQPEPVTTTLGEGTYCPGCGYDLRWAAAQRCPECGLRVDGTGAQVAWERRRHVGRFVAFARTAWLATVRPGRLARVAAGRAHGPSARRFRLVVLGVVTVTATMAFAAVVLRAGGIAQLAVLPEERPTPGLAAVARGWAAYWSAGAMVWPVLPIGLAIALWAGTQWDHWFVIRSLSPTQRNRAMAGARYAVAPLLVWGLALAVVALWAALAHSSDWLVDWAGSRVSWVLMAALALPTWAAPARYAFALPDGGAGRAAIVLAGTAAQWVVAIVVALGMFPVAVGLVWVMVDSLR